MGYREEYGVLPEELAREADAIAIRYFRTDDIRIDKKDDGSAVTQADRGVEEMARAKVAASGLVMDVLGEEMGGENAKGPSTTGRARLIIDPIDGTEEFSRGIATFGTLLGIERDADWFSQGHSPLHEHCSLLFLRPRHTECFSCARLEYGFRRPSQWY